MNHQMNVKASVLKALEGQEDETFVIEFGNNDPMFEHLKKYRVDGIRYEVRGRNIEVDTDLNETTITYRLNSSGVKQ